jgi:hypothetical protein
MATDLIHPTMVSSFFAMWAVVCHIAVVSRRAREDRREADVPMSGNVGQR